jgi:hypothetical protein
VPQVTRCRNAVSSHDGQMLAIALASVFVAFGAVFCSSWGSDTVANIYACLVNRASGESSGGQEGIL